MFREVTMIELKEVLRLGGKGLPKKRVAAQLGLDPKTVRRYLKAATAAGLHADGDPVSDEQVRNVLLARAMPEVMASSMLSPDVPTNSMTR